MNVDEDSRFEVGIHIEVEKFHVGSINIWFVTALCLVPDLTISRIFTFPTSIALQEGNAVLVKIILISWVSFILEFVLQNQQRTTASKMVIILQEMLSTLV